MNRSMIAWATVLCGLFVAMPAEAGVKRAWVLELNQAGTKWEWKPVEVTDFRSGVRPGKYVIEFDEGPVSLVLALGGVGTGRAEIHYYDYDPQGEDGVKGQKWYWFDQAKYEAGGGGGSVALSVASGFYKSSFANKTVYIETKGGYTAHGFIIQGSPSNTP